MYSNRCTSGTREGRKIGFFTHHHHQVSPEEGGWEECMCTLCLCTCTIMYCKCVRILRLETFHNHTFYLKKTAHFLMIVSISMFTNDHVMFVSLCGTLHNHVLHLHVASIYSIHVHVSTVLLILSHVHVCIQCHV